MCFSRAMLTTGAVRGASPIQPEAHSVHLSLREILAKQCTNYNTTILTYFLFLRISSCELNFQLLDTIKSRIQCQSPDQFIHLNS